MKKTAKHKISLTPSGRRASARSGGNLLEALREAGIKVYSACGGRGLCGSCQVR
ncbi:MAG TPA: 2Fe-2S iron-sulfur cluster-binding protein, partial [Candidatus Glassbacteria bacterium]|nr:2Fe-2S iron-sulfur cluster-binding protein [Candidatus Glassbacteria bacterium]